MAVMVMLLRDDRRVLVTMAGAGKVGMKVGEIVGRQDEEEGEEKEVGEDVGDDEEEGEDVGDDEGVKVGEQVGDDEGVKVGEQVGNEERG
jgi:hypothetical protein